MTKVATHLMFKGEAHDAIALYQSVFPNFSVEKLEKYGSDEDGAQGTVKSAHIEFAGQRLIIIDSPTEHEFGFTPSVSLYVDFENAAAMERAFDVLSKSGNVMMPPDDYGFSQRFTWISDRFGVSWQLNLSNAG